MFLIVTKLDAQNALCIWFDGIRLRRTLAEIQTHRNALIQSGALAKLRQDQRLEWLDNLLKDRLWESFIQHPDVSQQWLTIHSQTENGDVSVRDASTRLLALFRNPEQQYGDPCGSTDLSTCSSASVAS